jgi:hypothetical protein
MAVAFVALLAALSGTAIALPGTNTVDSGDIVNNSVRSKDIRNGTVGGKDIKNGSVKSLDVGDNSLTGTDINESTLGQVPSANTANSANSANTANTANTANSANTAGSADAVAGVTLRKVNYSGEVPSGSVEALNLGGLTLTAACAAGPSLTVTATTAANDARLLSASFSSQGVDDNNQQFVGNFDVGNAPEIVGGDALNPDDSTEVGQTEYRSASGSVVTVNWTASTNTIQGDCVFHGVALSG